MAENELCVALDGSDRRWIVATAAQVAEVSGWLKVGLEAFTAFGPPLVDELVGLGPRIFLDLKLHDIPNTVLRAAANCARAGVAMVNVHASGGRSMLEAAVDGARSGGGDTRVLAVTLLTSLDAEAMAEVGIIGSPQDAVLRLAHLARSCGLDGVVCSAHEAAAIRRELGADFLVVTPGIRPRWSSSDDQARIVTPRQALELGSDLLVVGRPITAAGSPLEAAAKILAEMRGIEAS